jgi:hypothetical protein
VAPEELIRPLSEGHSSLSEDDDDEEDEDEEGDDDDNNNSDSNSNSNADNCRPFIVLLWSELRRRS